MECMKRRKVRKVIDAYIWVQATPGCAFPFFQSQGPARLTQGVRPL